MPARRLLRAAFPLAVAFSSVGHAQSLRFDDLHRMFPPTTRWSDSLAVGDLDGDGDPDVVASGLNRLYRNEGAGAFRPAGELPGPFASHTNCVVLGDVDGDGDLDVLTGHGTPNGSDCERLFLNDGSGVFVNASAQIPCSASVTNAIALGDVDGDGDLDALVGNYYFEDKLYLNNGSGFFADAAANLPAVSGIPQTLSLAMGDLDGDGDLDAVLGKYGRTVVYFNNGSGVFTAGAQVLGVYGQVPEGVALADVDGDGDLDLILGNTAWSSAQGAQNLLYLNDGSGVFTVAAQSFPALVDQTVAVAVGDVDGDGDPDVLFGNMPGPNRLYLNNGLGVFAFAPVPFPRGTGSTRTVALADVDGDGDLDALIGTTWADRLYLNDGSGAFRDVTASLPEIHESRLAVAVGDVDGDSDPDVLIGTVGQNHLLRNDGTGMFHDATAQLPSISDATSAVALGDVDGEGDLDAVTGNGGYGSGQQNRLYRNDGSGLFTDVTATHLPAFLDRTYAIALGDVDGDGDLDLLIGNGAGSYSAGEQNRLYLNGGSGMFTDATNQIPAIVDHTRAVALGDVDGDGDLDALIGNSGQNRLHVNNGSGVFTDATGQLPGASENTFALALGDVDGDGDLDALIGNYGQNRLYLNDGTGVFADATGQLPAIADLTNAVALGDVDGDGDLDALIGDSAGSWPAQNRLYLNDGSGVFTDATTLLPAIPDFTTALALGDLDGDGDLDALVVPGSRQDRLLSNLGRQLAWRGLPRVGKPLTLDLYGPPIGAAVLAFSLARANLPIPPFGTLRLDPTANLHPVFASPLDGQGRASVTFAVPPDPSLTGSTVYWQAIVRGPPRFTNLEITTLSNL